MSGAGGTDGKPTKTALKGGKIVATASNDPSVVPTRSELYSSEGDDDDQDDDDDWATGDEGDEAGNKRRSMKSTHSRSQSGGGGGDGGSGANGPTTSDTTTLKDKVDGLAHKVQQAL